MSKSKHADSIPKLAEFRPPWITADGNEVEINKETLTKFIHNLIVDRAKALDARDEAKEAAETATTEKDELKAQVDSKDPDAAGKIAKAEKRASEAEAKVAGAELAKDRAEIALDKGLTLKQARRLQGETREELEADAEELIEDLGIKKAEETDEEREEREEREAEEAEDAGRITPRAAVRLTNGGDTRNSADEVTDFEKAVDQILTPRAL